MKKEIYVIKIWSNVLIWKDWNLDEKIIKNISNEVNSLKNNWVNIIIVTSWAVALWKIISKLDSIKWLTKTESSQVFSSIWQVKLMETYTKIFKNHDIIISQALLTRRDFADKERYNSMKKVLFTSLGLWIIPIINENDILSPEELDFSDNDELAALISAMMWAEKLIILSNIDWLYDSYPNWKLIKNVNKIDQKILNFVSKNKSSMWKGWMESKLKTAKMMLDLWIQLYIANWKKTNTLTDIFFKKNPWTRFESEKWKKVDSIRKWLKAWATPSWELQVSNIISDLLKSWKRASLLEIWVEKITKNFKIWDVVSVCDENWFCIWYGIAKMNSENIDKNHIEKRIVIHTNYFINI